MKTARLATALLAALTAQLAWAASEDFTVDESTGEGIYSYRLDLPSARGRYQPRLALVNRSGTQKEVNRPCTGVERWDLELFGAPRVLGGMYRDAPHSGRAIAYTSRGAPFHMAATVETEYMDFAGWSAATDAAGNSYSFPPSSAPLRSGYYADRVVDPDGNVTQWTYWRDAEGMPTATQELRYNSYTKADGTLGFATRITFSGDLRNGGDIRVVIENPDPAKPPTTLRHYRLAVSGTRLDSITEYAGESGPSRTSTFAPPGGAFPGKCKLTSVVTQAGVQYEVTYVSSDGTTGGSTPAYGAVSRVTRTGPALAPSVTRYWYSTPTFGKTWNDPGFQDYRGFAQSWSQDDATGIVRHTTWEVGSAAFNGRPAIIQYGSSTYADTVSPPVFNVFRTLKYWHATRAMASATACTGAGADPGAPDVPPADYPVIAYTAREQDIRVVGGPSMGTERSVACASVDSFGNVRSTTVDPDIAVPGDEWGEGASYESSFNPDALCKDCVRERWRGMEATRFTYTPTFQLQTVSRAVDSAGNYALLSTLAWEPNGNLRSKIEGAVTTAFTYDPTHQLRLTGVRVSQAGTATLVTDTQYDDSGRPSLVTGPYLEGSTPAPSLATAYDPFGRPRIVARAIAGTAVTGALAAVEYGDWPAASPAWVKTYAFAVPLSYADPSTPTTSDVRQTTTWLDGMGRGIQARERMGGSSAGSAGAAISQNLSQFRVSGAVVYDGAGRARAALEPYYSQNAGYQDVSTLVDASAGPVHATLATYDGQGRLTCSVRRYVGATIPAAGPCMSSFADDSNHALATRVQYGGGSCGAGFKNCLSVWTLPPENNVSFNAGERATQSYYDAAGLLRETSDAYGNQTFPQYDYIGRQTGLTRVPFATTRQVSTSVTLDRMGRVTSQSDPNFGKRTIAYDPVSPGLVQKVTFTRTGNELSYTYDKGRVATVKQCRAPVPTGGCTTDTLAYDTPYQAGYDYTAGRLSWVANGATTIAVGYDQNGTAVRRDQWFAGLATGFSTVATVRSDGRPTRTDLLAPGFATFTQNTTYDSFGRPAGLAAGGVTHWSATNVAANTGAYDAGGRPLGAGVDGGLVTQAWTYGAGSGLLSSQVVRVPGAANPLLYSVGSMTYRGTRLSGYTDQVSQTTYAFGYSDAGRLISAGATPTGAHPLAQNFTFNFSYNISKDFMERSSLGNLERVQETRPAGVTDTDRAYSGVDVETAPYAGPDAVTALSTPLPGGPERFEYDLLNRLTSVTRPSGTSEKLWYDPLGGLVARQLGTTVISYLGNGATVTGTLNAGCTAPSCGVTIATVDAHLIVGAKRIGSVRLGASPRTVYLHRDRLGSVVATTLAGGLAGASYRYGVYGATEAALGDAGNAASELGYAGALRLSDGLLLMGARVYHPGMKTFLQTDPLSPYAYRYTEGDPVNFVDPTGMESEPQGVREDGSTTIGVPVITDTGQRDVVVTDDGRTKFVYVERMTVTGERRPGLSGLERSGPGWNGASDRAFGDRLGGVRREGGDRGREGRGYWSRVWKNFVVTNKAIPGILSPFGVTFVTSGITAKAIGGVTPLGWIFSGFKGVQIGAATFTGMEAGVIAGATAVSNFAFVSVAFEVGVMAGSMINAAFTDD